MIFGTSAQMHLNHACISFRLPLILFSFLFLFLLPWFILRARKKMLEQFIRWILKWDYKQRKTKTKTKGIDKRMYGRKSVAHKSKLKWRKFGMCHTLFIRCYLLHLTSILCLWAVVFVCLIHFGAHKHIILNGFGGWSHDKIIICIYVSEWSHFFPIRSQFTINIFNWMTL